MPDIDLTALSMSVVPMIIFLHWNLNCAQCSKLSAVVVLFSQQIQLLE